MAANRAKGAGYWDYADVDLDHLTLKLVNVFKKPLNASFGMSR